MKKKTFFASLILTIMSFSEIAQSQLIYTPASSTGGSGVAVVAITPVSLPSNVCTSTNGNCYNSGTNPPPIASNTTPSGSICGFTTFIEGTGGGSGGGSGGGGSATGNGNFPKTINCDGTAIVITMTMSYGNASYRWDNCPSGYAMKYENIVSGRTFFCQKN